MKKLLFVLAWYLLVQASEPCEEPIYYEMQFNDDVSHYWSREVRDDYYGIRRETNDIINEKYGGKTVKEIDYFNVLQERSKSKREIEARLDSLMKVIMN